jgi:hypothetical protein
MPCPLVNPQLTGLQIDVREAGLNEFRLTGTGKEQEFAHHDVRVLACPLKAALR